MYCGSIASGEAVGTRYPSAGLYLREKCLLNVESTNAYNYISGFYFLANVFGSTIGSLLLSNHVYILNGLSIIVYLMTAFMATTVPAHYGRETLAEESVQPFLDSSDEASPSPRSPASTSSFLAPSSKVRYQVSPVSLLCNVA